MKTEECVVRQTDAAAEFNRQTGRNDGVFATRAFVYGFTVLRDLLYDRLHMDVQRLVGEDSMLMPVSESKTESKSKGEIEVYQISVSAREVQDRGYLSGSGDWYAPWLSRLRLGAAADKPTVSQRLEHYLSQSPEDARLDFSNNLVKYLSEAGRAPLVVYRLFPLAVRIVTAMAFNDLLEARELRNRQISLLPAIGDCAECHGRLLESGERCRQCSNPMWKFEWLTATD